jgi:hypothetical protein
MADISDKIAELAKGKKDDALAARIRDRLPAFVMECEESLKSPLQRGVETIKRMDRMGL